MFDFGSSLNDGKEKADDIERMQVLFNEVFCELEKELSIFIGEEIKLEHNVDYETVIDNTKPSYSNSLSIIDRFYQNNIPRTTKRRTGYSNVKIEPKDSKSPSEVLFKYKESKNVFPVYVLFERDETRCTNQEELVSAIKSLVSNGQFHLKLRSFMSKLSGD